MLTDCLQQHNDDGRPRSTRAVGREDRRSAHVSTRRGSAEHAVSRAVIAMPRRRTIDGAVGAVTRRRTAKARHQTSRGVSAGLQAASSPPCWQACRRHGGANKRQPPQQSVVARGRRLIRRSRQFVSCRIEEENAVITVALVKTSPRQGILGNKCSHMPKRVTADTRHIEHDEDSQ